MSNIVEWLRERARGGFAHDELDEEAADEIERLRLQRTEMLAALRDVETVLMIVEPRSHKVEYLEALDKVRAAILRLPNKEGK